MTERRTGRFVQMELVWVGNYLHVGPMMQPGEGAVWCVDDVNDVWDCWVNSADRLRKFLGIFPTRAEAEDAVERAVIERMGGVDA